MKTKRLICLLMTLALCLFLFPSALAVEEDSGVRVRKADFNFVEGNAKASLQGAAESFPSSYDLRHVPLEGSGETSYITPVKLQNPYGTCWGFAAIAAAESSLLSSGLAAKDGYDVNTLDLSEKQIAFFATSFVDDADSPQYGEGLHFRNIPADQKNTCAYRYGTGGTTFMATSQFASGTGPVLESEDPVFAYRGKRGETAYWEAATQYDNEGKPVESSYRSVPVWYSDQDDWSLPDSCRYQQSYRLRDSIILPSPAGYDENGEYEYHPEAVEAIKEQISRHHRAVCIGFCAESFLPGQDTGGKLYMSENWAHFTNDFEYSNHSVTIVGYDDNYPASNFDSTTEKGNPARPEGDGAFLVKNSWGSELNEFPTNGYRHWGLLDGLDGVPYDANATAKSGNRATGYFWLSYYDRSLDDPEAFVFDRAAGENGCYIQQMDLMNASSILEAMSDEEIMMANVFTAEATAALSEISVMTTVPGATVSYAVYLLGEGYRDPQDGILIETGERSFAYGGYHRFQLESPRVLARGQQYSVVIREKTEDSWFICYSAEYDYAQNPFNFVGIVNKGESFLHNGTKWGDLSDPAVKAELTAVDAPVLPDIPVEAAEATIDNFPIKAYLEPVTYSDGEDDTVFPGYLTVNNWQEGNPGVFTLTVGESKTLTAEFRGLGKDFPKSWDPSYEWEAANEQLLSVSTGTPKKGNAVITGLKPGVTQLIVYAGDDKYDRTHYYPDNYGVRVLTIRVNPGPNDTYINSVENVTVDSKPACTAVIQCAQDASVTAYGARYDADGRFLSVEPMELEPGENNTFTVLYDGADAIRFFALDDAFAPVCESVTAPAVSSRRNAASMQIADLKAGIRAEEKEKYDFTDLAMEYLEYIGKGVEKEDLADWICDELIKAGYRKDQISVQEFTYTDDADEKQTGRNIILKVEGEDPSRQIVAGAHYDGDGVGDNGSGTALLLANAVGLAGIKPHYSLDYVFFDAEEEGLLGSDAYAQSMTEEEVDATFFMINIDALSFGDYCNIYGGDASKMASNDPSGGMIEAYDFAADTAEQLGFRVMRTEDLDGYFKEHGTGPEIEAGTLYTNPWTDENPSPVNYCVPSPTTLLASDYVGFMSRGIEYIYFEAANWFAGDENDDPYGISYIAYYETYDDSIGDHGMFMNTPYDTWENLNKYFPGRTEEHYEIFSPLLSALLLAE